MQDDQNLINPRRLLWAGFTAILATGLGFGIRGGILAAWGAEFGFSSTELGAISGAGLTGFCFGILTGGLVCDRLGYGRLVLAAFLLHLLSAGVTLAASPEQGPEVARQLLYWGTFLFALANGTLEAVANPLVATLFPQQRTHYLNILHASWPLGLLLGGIVGWSVGERWSWQSQLALFLLPTLAYGLLFLGQRMPRSLAATSGLKLSAMLADIGMLGGLVLCGIVALFFATLPLPGGQATAVAIGLALWLLLGCAVGFRLGAVVLFFLFVAHALVGAVELGTDGWIQNITGNLLTPTEGKLLFVFTSAIMFGLRFAADWIERRLRLDPVGLLLVCAVLACAGLLLASGIATFAGALLALGVYALGKTFFWPTLLAVASDRFPRTGAIAISCMGGIGMMAGGLLGMPGLGYAKDRFAAEALQREAPAVFAKVRAEEASQFLFFAPVHGIDGKQLGAAKEQLGRDRAALSTDQHALLDANMAGDRATLRADAWIPATMAVLFLGLWLHFRRRGGYRVLVLEQSPAGPG